MVSYYCIHTDAPGEGNATNDPCSLQHRIDSHDTAPNSIPVMSPGRLTGDAPGDGVTTLAPLLNMIANGC